MGFVDSIPHKLWNFNQTTTNMRSKNAKMPCKTCFGDEMLFINVKKTQNKTLNFNQSFIALNYYIFIQNKNKKNV